MITSFIMGGHAWVDVPRRLVIALDQQQVREEAAPSVLPCSPCWPLQIKPAYNVYGARLYKLKGIDPPYARFYGVRPVPQGVIVGKRFGYSDLLRPSACRAARVYWTQIKRAAAAAAAHL